MDLMDQASYIEGRVDEQLSWLSRRSRSNKRLFIGWRLVEILLGTSITILSPFASSQGWVPLTIALAGGGIALSGAILALNRHQENWVRYRALAETLKREKFLFLTGVPPYEAGAAAFPRFVANAEDLMLEERGAWVRQMSDTPTPAVDGAKEEASSAPTAPAASPATEGRHPPRSSA